MANNLDIVVNSIRIPKEKKIQKWQRAFEQGRLTGYKNLDPKRTRSIIYRIPKVASIPWNSGFASGIRQREEEEDKRKHKK